MGVLGVLSFKITRGDAPVRIRPKSNWGTWIFGARLPIIFEREFWLSIGRLASDKPQAQSSMRGGVLGAKLVASVIEFVSGFAAEQWA
jgi:hypothetical protein